MTASALQLPTLAQYHSYRAERRKSVRRIISCVRSQTIPLSPWAVSVIKAARVDHSRSIVRQLTFGTKG